MDLVFPVSLHKYFDYFYGNDNLWYVDHLNAKSPLEGRPNG